jgi:hypothetical protein
MNKSDTIGELAKALCKAQHDFGPLVKGATNPFFKSSYSTLAAVIDVSRTPLHENGLCFTQTNEPDEPGFITVDTTLIHESGEWIQGRIRMPLAKNDPQGYGSSFSYAKRYALQAILGLASEDDDAESATQRKAPVGKSEPQKPPVTQPEPQVQPQGQETPITAPQRKKLWAMMKEAGLNQDDAKSFYDRIAPKTSADASTFIDSFEALLTVWKKDSAPQQEPGHDPS